MSKSRKKNDKKKKPPVAKKPSAKQPTLPPIKSLADATEADLTALDKAGTAILDASAPPMPTIGEDMATLTATIGERVIAAGAVVPDPARPPLPPGATPRKQRSVCKLAPDERLAISAELCGKLTERDEVDAEKKTIAKEFSDRLTALDSSILRLKNNFETGSEQREIDVYDVRDIVAKKVQTYREDTRELIDERDMRPHELQMELDDVKTRAIADGKSDEEIAEIQRQIEQAAAEKDRALGAAAETEEQQIASTPEEAEAIRAARLEQEARDRAEAGDPPGSLLSSDNMRRGRNRNPDPEASAPADDDIPFGEGDDAERLQAEDEAEARGESLTDEQESDRNVVTGEPGQ